jgi:hypothetical protein
MSAESTQIILSLLRQYSPADVPGYARLHHDLIVSHERVREINALLAKDAKQRCIRSKHPLARKLPDDFHQYAKAERNPQLASRYKVSTVTITRWRREAGIPAGDHRLRPVPKTFYLFAPQTTRNQLAKQYEASTETIDRWLKEAGISAKRNKPGSSAFGYKAVVTRDRIDGSIAGRAATFLQRLAPVNRCDDDGRANPAGRWWRYGRVILTAESLLERAARSGWDADEWRHIPGQSLPQGDPSCA